MFEENDQFELSRYKWVIPFVVVILIVSLIFVKCSSNNLKGYVESSSLNDSSSQADKSTLEDQVLNISESTSLYQDEDIHFSLEIPESWTKVAGENNNVSFIDKNRGTQLNITIKGYDPSINTVDEDLLQQQASAANMTIREYDKTSNSKYSVSYTSSKYGYIDYVYWDYNTVITLSFMIDGKYYNDSDVNKTIRYIHQTFNWVTENPIPDDLQMAYLSYGNFEFGFPKDWNYGESSDTIMITNPEGSAAITISVTEAASTLEAVSQVDCVNYLSQIKPNFILDSFSNTGTMVTCTGTYQMNGTKLNVQQYIMVNNGYEYTLSFDTEAEVTSGLTTTIQKVINSFRCF